MASTNPVSPHETGGKRPANRFLFRLPLILTLLLVLFGGVFLLHRSAAQARDTTRKHHLQDLENTLYFARALHGTYPPYNLSSWCGFITPAAISDARDQLETALRQQNALYAKPDKPFPSDPLAEDQSPPTVSAPAGWRGGTAGGRSFNYFYWKRSPAVFELFAQLETDPHAIRSLNCAGVAPLAYNYSLTSIWRENR